MTSDLLEENQDLRKQVADLEKELAISEHDREHDNYELVEVYQRIEQLEKENAELKEKNEGYCRSRDRLISIGFPTFEDCKEYAEHLTKAKEIIKTCLGFMQTFGYSPSMDKFVTEAEQFLKE